MSFLGWVLWGFSSFPPNVVLGGQISGGREREIVEERRGRGGGAMMLFVRARPIGLVRPTRPEPFSRPTLAEERKSWFARAPILQTHADGRERISWVAGARPNSNEKIKKTRKWKRTCWGSELDRSWPVRMIC
jgi:hypothetical protein